MVTERLSRRLEILLKSRDLMERVEKVCHESRNRHFAFFVFIRHEFIRHIEIRFFNKKHS